MLTHLDGYAIVRARKGFTENPRLSARAAHGAAAYILSHVDVLEPRFRRPDSESERVTRHAHETCKRGRSSTIRKRLPRRCACSLAEIQVTLDVAVVSTCSPRP